MTELDHIAVIAPDLGTGVAWVREALGVEMPAGGKHPEMGTHNRLVGLGPDVYLEVIAVDPEAPRPPHRRWFGLDDHEEVERYWREGRRLGATWRAAPALPPSSVRRLGRSVCRSASRAATAIGCSPSGPTASCHWTEPPPASSIGWSTARRRPPCLTWGSDCRACASRLRTPMLSMPLCDAIGMARKPEIGRGPEVRLAATIATPGGMRVLN